jgi:hypothetical protein
VTETITYIPGPMDPPVVKWAGYTFQANVPKELTGNAEGTAREKLNMHMIENARGNNFYKVGSGNSRPRREVSALPTTAEEYRAYMVDWLKDPHIEHAEQLIARFARDHDLQVASEVGADDYAYLATLFMPKLSDLAKADELTEGQVASIWINHGINQLPW